MSRFPSSFSEFTAGTKLTKENSSQQIKVKSMFSSDIVVASLEDEFISRADDKLKHKQSMVLARDQV